MSDTPSSSPDAPDGKDGNQDAPDGTPKDKTDSEPKLSKTEQEAIERRDSAMAKARKEKEAREAAETKLAEANERLKELDDLKRKNADDDAAQKGNIEAIRKSAAETEGKLKERITALEAELKETKEKSATEVASLKRTYLVEAEVKRTLSEVTVDPELVWLLLGSKFELAEDDGKFGVQVKDSTLDVKSYVEKTLEESNRANLLKSTRKAGTGTDVTPGDGKGKDSKYLTPEQIEKLPDKGKEYFRKNPQAARQYAADRKLGK